VQQTYSISDIRILSDIFESNFMRLPYFLILPISILILSISANAKAPQHNDLQDQWMVNVNNQYIPFQLASGKISTIYFTLNAHQFRNGSLVIEGSREVYVFVQGKIVWSGKHRSFTIDSLARMFNTAALSIAIRQHNLSASRLKTYVSMPGVTTEKEEKRVFASFRDFSIMGMLLLSIMVVVIIQSNPKLAADYFSVTRVFSLREGDDSQLSIRIGSSTNILFYLYCSLLVSYYLMLCLHELPFRYALASTFYSSTFGSAFGDWLQLSILFLLVLFAKMILVYALSTLFGIKEVASAHFFNWIRFLLIIFALLGFILFVYFIAHGNNPGFYKILFQLIAWMLVGWVILIFLKLSGKTSASMFHLFSYICATELIPFLILVKVLYN
jgi:hypothetical protein